LGSGEQEIETKRQKEIVLLRKSLIQMNFSGPAGQVVVQSWIIAHGLHTSKKKPRKRKLPGLGLLNLKSDPIRT
jgi:hypothetical protein